MQRSVLITGCSSGIGLACARKMAARGWRVFATARKEQDLERLSAMGLTALRLELKDSASVAACANTVLAATEGQLFALVNNAAYGQPGAVEDLPRAVLEEQFQVNLFGTMELTNLFLPAMRARGSGRVVFVSSLLGYVALPYRGAYVASKFALEGMVDTLRLELAGSGIHAVLIEPGPISTHFRANAYAAWSKQIEAGRIRPDASPHRERYVALVRRLTKEGAVAPFTLPPEAVAKSLVHALEMRRPRTRYRVTFPATLFWYGRRWLPDRWLDRLLGRVGEKETS